MTEFINANFLNEPNIAKIEIVNKENVNLNNEDLKLNNSFLDGQKQKKHNYGIKERKRGGRQPGQHYLFDHAMRNRKKKEWAQEAQQVDRPTHSNSPTPVS